MSNFKNLLVLSNQRIRPQQNTRRKHLVVSNQMHPAQLVSWSQIPFGTPTAQRLRRPQLPVVRACFSDGFAVLLHHFFGMVTAHVHFFVFLRFVKMCIRDSI